MRQEKTALVLRLAALAVSILFITDARAAGDVAAAESAAATQAVEQAPAREQSAAVVEANAGAAQLDWPQSESAAVAVNSRLVCWTSAELFDLVDPNEAFGALSFAETIVGIASFYHEPQQTASGEPFDPDAFTAAAQLEIRDKFGGIRFGVKYQPAYAVAEYEGKKLILKFNDVGPLRPGRKFDLSRAAFAYFDGLEKGLLPDVKVTP
ncbi:MAG TPA: septal ring lytic transglycosylase RlpA family protein, partial [Xanthobacteraceae bacterium]|nr:septal ring lytic transglycosylase RlpA family protein [Xanthobacteraceae bacterium]